MPEPGAKSPQHQRRRRQRQKQKEAAAVRWVGRLSVSPAVEVLVVRCKEDRNTLHQQPHVAQKHVGRFGSPRAN